MMIHGWSFLVGIIFTVVIEFIVVCSLIWLASE